MTKSYIVSGQGARFSDDKYIVPADVEIHFYFTRRSAPQIYKTRTALEKLMVEIGMFPDFVATAGEAIPAHYCWAYPEVMPSTGVFRRSTGYLAMDLADATAQRPIALSHIVRELTAGREQKMTAIHWLARTEETAGSSSALECLTPPRLPGSGGDSSESSHVPLTKF